MNKRALGKKYEEKACQYLESQGMKIVEKNFRCRQGEIDLIGFHGEYLAFVEVKYRRDTGSGYPEEAVSRQKQQRIRHTASYYLYRRGYGEDVPCRFDVVSMTDEEILVVKNAFDSTDL